MTAARLGPVPPDTPPLDPTAQHAREQVAHELGKPQYTAARPSGLDLAIQQIEKWFDSLFNNIHGVPGGSALIVVIIVVVIVAAIVIAFLVFGLPRLNRRSSSAGSLFGEDDARGADTLRRAAESAAAAGDFGTAIEEGFRAIARGLAERVIVVTFPGTTAHNFAAEASGAFPGYSERLSRAADTFDGVRYLGAPGTENEWMAVRSLEVDLRRANPVLDAVPA